MASASNAIKENGEKLNIRLVNYLVIRQSCNFDDVLKIKKKKKNSNRFFYYNKTIVCARQFNSQAIFTPRLALYCLKLLSLALHFYYFFFFCFVQKIRDFNFF